MSTAVGPDLCYTRGDTAPISITFKQSGVALDLTGFTVIEMVINSEENPATAANEIERFAGSLSGTPTDGVVTFIPPSQVASENLPISEESFYDVQWLNAAAQIQTPIKGKIEIAQGINKA